MQDDPAAGDAGAHRRRRRRARTRSETDSFISFLRGFLLAFGGIALFVGSFVIANSLSITIAQRTREFATLRTLGAIAAAGARPRSWSRRSSMGVLASVTGLFLGLGLAKGLFKLFDAVGFTLPNSGLVFATRTIVDRARSSASSSRSLASLRPALRATRVPPIAAVREGATLPGSASRASGRSARRRLTAARLRRARCTASSGRPRHDQRCSSGWGSARC